MSLRLRFAAEDLLKCRFAISPLRETQGAIRTLARPDRHGYHLPWLRQVRPAAAGLDLAAVWLLSPEHGHGPDFLHPVPEMPLAALEDEIAAIRATPPDVARRQIAGALAQTPGAGATRRGRAMLSDPAGTVQQIAGLYEHAWRELLAPHWPRLRAVLEADVAYHARRLADGGMQRLFTGLHPKLSWSEGALTAVVRPALPMPTGLAGRAAEPAGQSAGAGAGRTAGQGAVLACGGGLPGRTAAPVAPPAPALPGRREPGTAATGPGRTHGTARSGGAGTGTETGADAGDATDAMDAADAAGGAYEAGGTGAAGATGGRSLVLVPSVFFWPEAASAFDPPGQSTVVYPARGIGGLWAETGPTATTALVRLLGANRAAILTGLDAPSTTTALAHRHDMAMSSVSAHLGVLRDAGLLASRRYGHQVLYERTPLGIAVATGGLL